MTTLIRLHAIMSRAEQMKFPELVETVEERRPADSCSREQQDIIYEAALTLREIAPLDDRYVALAKNAYDELVKERNQPALSDEIVRLGLSEVPSLDQIIITDIGGRIAKTFSCSEPRPQTVIVPFCGAEYDTLQKKLKQELLANEINELIPKIYTVKNIIVDTEGDLITREALGWQRPVGEVRVEFGVRQ